MLIGRRTSQTANGVELGRYDELSLVEPREIMRTVENADSEPLFGRANGYHPRQIDVTTRRLLFVLGHFDTKNKILTLNYE